MYALKLRHELAHLPPLPLTQVCWLMRLIRRSRIVCIVICQFAAWFKTSGSSGLFNFIIMDGLSETGQPVVVQKQDRTRLEYIQYKYYVYVWEARPLDSSSGRWSPGRGRTAPKLRHRLTLGGPGLSMKV